MFNFKNNNINCVLNIKENYFIYGNKLRRLNINSIANKKYIYLKFNTSCNINCIYCFQSNDNKINSNILISDYNNLLTNINDYEPVIFGGEPLLPTNISILEYIFEQTMETNKIKFFTNACYTSFYNEFLNKYKYKINVLVISIDGPERIHNFRRVMKNNNPYKIILNNINYYINNDIPYVIQINLDMDNFNFLDELLSDLNKEYDNCTVNITLNKVLHTTNSITEVELIKSYIDVKNKYPNFHITVNSIVLRKICNYISNKGLDRSRCMAGESLILDFMSNNIYACPQSMDTIIGSFDNERISIIKDYQEALINTRNKVSKKCSECEYVNFCKFGCAIDDLVEVDNCVEETHDEIQYILDNFNEFFELKSN